MAIAEREKDVQHLAVKLVVIEAIVAVVAVHDATQELQPSDRVDRVHGLFHAQVHVAVIQYPQALIDDLQALLARELNRWWWADCPSALPFNRMRGGSEDRKTPNNPQFVADYTKHRADLDALYAVPMVKEEEPQLIFSPYL